MPNTGKSYGAHASSTVRDKAQRPPALPATQHSDRAPSAAWRDEIEQRARGAKRPAPPPLSSSSARAPAFPSDAFPSQQLSLPRAPVALPTLSCLLQRAAPVDLEAAPTPLYKHQRTFAPLGNDDLVGADTERLRRILDEEVACYNQRAHGHEQRRLDAARVVPDTLRRPNYASSGSSPLWRDAESLDAKRLSASSSSSCSPGSSSDAASPLVYPMKPPRSPQYATSQQQQIQQQHMPAMQRHSHRDHHHNHNHRALSRRYDDEQYEPRRYALERDDEAAQDIEADHRMASTPPPSLRRYPVDHHHDAAIETAVGLVQERSSSKRESITKLLLKSKEFLQAKSLVRNRHNEIDWVATFLNVGFESSSIYSLMCPLRKGRWKVEEEKYTMELLRLIESGTIRLRHGQSIRGFVAKKLHSDDMRVLKKLSNCKLFHFARLITPQMADEDEIDESVPGAAQGLEQLRKLRSEFLRSVQLEALVAVRKYLSDSSIRELLNGRTA